MGIDKDVQDAIDQLRNAVEKDYYGSDDADAFTHTVHVPHVYVGDSTTDGDISIPNDSTSAGTSGPIWVDSTSKDIFIGPNTDDPWGFTSSGGNSVTLTLGNMELMITEAGEAKITVTEGEDKTEYYFSASKTKKFLEQFADMTVTGKKDA